MNRGYIKLFRKLRKSPLWMLDPITFKVAICLLLEANYEPKTEFIHAVGRNVEIGRGELITSYNSIAEGCRYRGRYSKVKTPTYSQVRTSVDKLKKLNFIAEVMTDRCLHYRIEKYDLYQSWPENMTEFATDKIADTSQTHRNEQEVKNKPPKPPKGNDGSFERFWEAYPKKVGKGAARKAWKKVKTPKAELLPKVLAAIERQKKGEQWRKDGGQFIPHPATWLNQERWDDVVAPAVGDEWEEMPDGSGF